jgi:hypothetical protein
MMRHLKLFGLTLTVLCMVGIGTATSAFALPLVSVTLSGATYPMRLEVTLLTVKTQLANVLKENLAGEGLLLVLLLTESGHLGTFEASFTKIKNKAGTKPGSTGVVRW